MSWRERSPGPFSLWARYEPKAWSRPSWLHLDPLAAALGRIGTTRDELPAFPVIPPDPPDVVYLPPVEPECAAARDELAARVAAAGGHALVHLRAGEAVTPPGSTPVIDLLEPLAAGMTPDRLELPRGSWVLFPLVAGLAREGDTAGWLARLAMGGAAGVVGVGAALEPADRRRLADAAGEVRWQAIFHGAPPDERDFARAVAASGLAPLPPQPDVVLPPRSARNRTLAGWLAEAGELGARLGRGAGASEALLAAARRAGATPLDLVALAREGNLGVVDWLDEPARRLIAQAAASGFAEPPAELERLRREWRGEGEVAR